MSVHLSWLLCGLICCISSSSPLSVLVEVKRAQIPVILMSDGWRALRKHTITIALTLIQAQGCLFVFEEY